MRLFLRNSMPSVMLFVLSSALPLLAKQPPCQSPPPNTPAQHLATASCLASHRLWALADQEVRLYRLVYPSSVDGAVLQARILLELNLAPDATGVLDRVLAFHPHAVSVLSLYAGLSETLGDAPRAEQLLMQCTKYAPTNPEVWIRLGDFYLKNGRKGAISSFQRALAIQPNNPLARSGLASAFSNSGDPHRASAEFHRAVVLNQHTKPPQPLVELRFADFLREQEKYQESLIYYDLAVREDPALLDARFGRALSLVKLQEWDLAERDAILCAQDPDKQIPALTLLLKIYQEHGKPDQVAECAKKLELLSNSNIAAKTSGNQIAARLREAHLLENDHKSSEADELYQKLLVDHPEVDAAWLGLGISHANLSLVDAADSDFRRFLSSHPDSPSAHLYLGKILLRKKRPEEARRELLQSKQLDPLLLEARLGIAASFITQARYSEAIAELRAAEKLPAHPPELRLMLAEALYKNLDSPAALRELELLLKEDPVNPRALQMRSSLFHAESAP